MEPGVTLVPPTDPVEPGGVGTALVRVRNTGAVVDEFRIELVGPVAAFASVEPAELRLFPGDHAEATVRFQPPRDASAPAGAQTFAVRVTPVAEPASAVVEESVVTIGGFAAISADISPHNVDGASATHTVTVRNAGNAATTVALSYADPDERTAGSLHPDDLQVAGGDEATATLKVVAKGGKRKAATRLGYQVHVRPAEGMPITLDASLTRAGKRRKTPILAAVLVLLVGLVAFVALRPKVESAAVEIKELQAQVVAAKSSVEEAQEQIAAAKLAAAAGGEAAGANATTTTATTELPATTVPEGTTDTTVAATGGDSAEAPTTTQSPEVAAALTGEEAFGTVAQPKITCVGSGSSSSTTTRASTTSSTSD
jgi:outer membrane murein-binding lipoprotein Lpp